MKSVFPLLLLGTGLPAAQYNHTPNAAEEFRGRDGLPNVFVGEPLP